MNKEPENETVAEISVGQLLRQAREQRKLTIQQVALQLNLKAEQVERLEQDQPDGRTLETFARGYVRAYGRLLKLPETELMAALSRQTGSAASTAKPMRTFSNRTAHQATENRFMWLTYAIIALLLVLLFVWWWQSARENTADSSSIPASQPVEARTQPVSPQPTTEVPAAQATDEQAASMGSAADNAISEQQLNEMLQQLVPPSTEPVPAVEVPQLDTLEMRFSENCWIDVVDAEGNRVAYGTKQAGYIMQLTGKAPFVITLGNPSVVRINFNQQAFDMSAFPGGRVAKFTIPESE
ncbi:cytoskeleton protein RodZ [Rheinheimera pacifica]|uniref:Cytoskeleton protein RodZ n=1 Tax=Rheinheimera pacifica TaxID=173990 RepID=A0A1H6JJL8_9GAMM|nr:RodZ domain-containing protein [Rheinheimera pacifica]SEH59200.1 cytoskeleton protein RodZ [Rheinheimera pacifica]